MARIDLATQVAPATPSTGFASGYFDSTTKRWTSKDDSGLITSYIPGNTTASVAAVAGGYASDTYLAGSAITVPVAGDFSARQTYYCLFDMTKTAAGIAAFTITIRMGTLGTTSDAAILVLAFGIGSAAIDSGRFEVSATFRTVGSGTSAVLAGMACCGHHLAATGLISTGAAGFGMVTGTSSGFNSTTQTIIGVSVNGGTSFAGTNTIVQTQLVK